MYKNKYSCADFSFPLLRHDKVLRLIKLLGIDAIDLGVFEGRSHLYPSHIASDPVGKGWQLARELNGEGLEVADVFLQTGTDPSIAAVNSPRKAIRTKNRDVFLKTLAFTKTLGGGHITGLPGVVHQGETFQDDWNRSCEETLWRIEAARSLDIVYSVEPHLGSLLPDAETTLKFIRDCPGLTLTLDYGHFICQGQTNASVHPLIAHASHFHARGGAKGKLQTRVKENEIDFKTILSRFKQIEYAGFICMEYVYQDWGGCNRTDNISETIQLCELLSSLVA